LLRDDPRVVIAARDLRTGLTGADARPASPCPTSDDRGSNCDDDPREAACERPRDGALCPAHRSSRSLRWPPGPASARPRAAGSRSQGSLHRHPTAGPGHACVLGDRACAAEGPRRSLLGLSERSPQRAATSRRAQGSLHGLHLPPGQGHRSNARTRRESMPTAGGVRLDPRRGDDRRVPRGAGAPHSLSPEQAATVAPQDPGSASADRSLTPASLVGTPAPA